MNSQLMRRLFLPLLVATTLPGCSNEGGVLTMEREVAEPAQILINPSAEFKVEPGEHGTVVIEGKGAKLVVMRWPANTFQEARSGLARQAAIGTTQSRDIRVPEAVFTRGQVRGYKYKISCKDSGLTLESSYMLAVPGGYISAKMYPSSDSDSDVFDELKLEPILSTVRIVPDKAVN